MDCLFSPGYQLGHPSSPSLSLLLSSLLSSFLLSVLVLAFRFYCLALLLLLISALIALSSLLPPLSLVLAFIASVSRPHSYCMPSYVSSRQSKIKTCIKSHMTNPTSPESKLISRRPIFGSDF